MKNKLLLTVLLSSPLVIASGSALASDFGCEALLCFAGGKNVSECQPTIKKVLKDLAKGKSFPHCSFVSSPNLSGGSSSGVQDAISVKHYNSVSRNRTCPDGVTRAKSLGFGAYSCPTIEINIKPEFASDKEHQKQIYNYNF